MKKKIGASKSIKKMQMGGPGPTDSIPSGPKLSPEQLERMRRKADRPYKTPAEIRTKTVKPPVSNHELTHSTTMKKGGSVGKKPKMAKGGSVPFGMLSVKAGVDKNPKPTAADRIAGSKMKKGGMVKSKKK